MIAGTSILTNDSESSFVYKAEERYLLPKAEVLHIDRLRVLKEISNSSVKKIKVFLLTQNSLYCLIGEPAYEGQLVRFRAKARIDLQWALCKYHIKMHSGKRQHLIEFVKNNKRIAFEAIDEEGFQRWRDALRLRIVHVDFEDKYQKTNIGCSSKRRKTFKLIEKEFGEVYLAEQVSKQKLQDFILVRGLKRQITIMKELKGYGGVAQLHEVQETDDAVYLVYEPFSERPVFNHNCKYPLRVFLKILRNIFAVLRLLEVKGIQHRRLRPANIHFRYSNRPIEQNDIIITDFSCASFDKQSTGSCNPSREHFPRTIGQRVAKSAANPDVIDTGLIALSYLYYVQFNKPLEKTSNYSKVIFDPKLLISPGRKLNSKAVVV